MIIMTLLALAALAACRKRGEQPERRTASEHRSPGFSSSPSVSGLPDWVPIYPGARVTGLETRNAGIETYTEFRLEAPADCEKVVAWYDEKLKLSGFDVSKSTSRVQGCDGILRAEGLGHTRGCG
ncbi:MAG: hypothetical protein HY695_27170 [Deltaproteobacteria bacterium]|nr:hypothetical protein [Deltaproteobacteria bacterium]